MWNQWPGSCGNWPGETGEFLVVFSNFLCRSTQQISDFSGFLLGPFDHLGPQDYEKLLAEAAQVPSEDLSINIRGWLLSVPCSMSLWIIWIPDLLGCSMLFISFIIFHVPMWWGFTPLPGSITQSCNLNRPKVAATDLDSWNLVELKMRPRWAWGADGVSGGSQTANWSGHRWALGIALVLEMGCFRVEGCWRLKMHWCALNVPGRSD